MQSRVGGWVDGRYRRPWDFVVWHTIKVNLNAVCKFHHISYTPTRILLYCSTAQSSGLQLKVVLPAAHTHPFSIRSNGCIWKEFAFYKILLFAIYTRRPLFHKHTNASKTHTIHVHHVVSMCLFDCCKQLAFVNVTSLLHGIILLPDTRRSWRGSSRNKKMWVAGRKIFLNAFQDVCPRRMSLQPQKRKERIHCACN